MDFFLYLIVIACVGLFKMRKGSDDVQNILANEPAAGEINISNIPIGNNMQLLKEEGAYMLIVEELGLM